MNYANPSAEYPHGAPKCQACGWVGPWNVEPVLMTHHIIIFVVLLLAFGGGLIYLVIILIMRSNDSSRGKICPNCGSKNMHTFVYADAPGQVPAPYPAQQPYGAPAQQPYVAPSPQPLASSATTFNPSGASAGARSAVVYANGVAVRTLVLTPGTRYTVGRGSDSSVQIADSMVSGHHGVFEVDADGTLMYTDSGSTNGSFLNGSQVFGAVRITPADMLTLGSENMRVAVSM